MNSGTVYWITGVSGVGKTTIGRLLYQYLTESKPNVIFLDGDHLREVFGNDLGHGVEDRRKSAMRNARLCKLLSDQGIDVVCSTISLFHECQRWNRENICNYKEIFIDAPAEVLISRDAKGLYKAAMAGETAGMVGIHIKEERPLNPELTILNDGGKTPAEIVCIVVNELLDVMLPTTK